MPPIQALVLSSDEAVREVAASALSRGGAVDAVAVAVFAAAGLHPSVLLGPVQVLVGGAGAGQRAVDGRTRQPGLGHPRPRGFLSSEPVPAAARVGVPALPAALLAVVTTYGKLSVAACVGPGIELARAKSEPRAAVLGRIAARGPAALADQAVADELVASAGRVAGGLLSARDLDEVRPVLCAAKTSVLGPDTQGREVLTVPWGASAVRERGAAAVPAPEVRVVIAADRHGLVAAACYAVPHEGLAIDPLGLVAPFTAAPVLRRETRVKPGEPRSSAAPIALGRLAGVMDLAVGIGGAEHGETSLFEWLSAYTPASVLERSPLPSGLLLVERAGNGWA